MLYTVLQCLGAIKAYVMLCYVMLCYGMLCYVHSFIHSRIYKAPLQEIYSEAPPAQSTHVMLRNAMLCNVM